MSSLFASTLNTRALPTGDMRYIRSDLPAALSDDEAAWLLENNVTVIIDLREPKEYEAKPCRLENESGFEYYHMPVTGGGDVPCSRDAVADSYLAMLDGRMDKIVDTILNAGSGVMFFCNAGKDRTGVVAAVLLKRLDFCDEVIIGDYMATKDNLAEFLTAYAAEHPEVDIETIMPNEDNIKSVLKVI